MKKFTIHIFASALLLLVVSIVNAGDKFRSSRTTSRLSLQNIEYSATGVPHIVSAKQGFNLKLLMGNDGTLGRATNNFAPLPPGYVACEYPVGSDIEHIFGGGLWVGGILDTSTSGPPVDVLAVTTAYEGWIGPYFEFFPSDNPLDDIWVVTDTVKPPQWDAYWGNSLPFRKISDQDFYCTYTDTVKPNVTPRVIGHVPLHLKVIQKSYSWTEYADAIIPLEYRIINMGTRPIRSAYVADFIDTDVGPVYIPGFEQHDFAAYYQDLRTAYVSNPIDRGSTPIGVTVLNAPRPLDSLRYTFRWYPGGDSPTPDDRRYQFMSSGIIMPDQSINDLSDTRFLFSFGPFDIVPTETLKVVVAVVAGLNLDDIRRNAKRALEIYQRGYKLPVIPPAPPLRVKVGFRRVDLDWRWRPGDPRFDPETTWDDSNKIAESDSLRRDSTGVRRGGRIFEGYRVYRSEDPNGEPSSFTLIREFDDPRDRFEFNTGLQYTFVDSNLVRGKRYWYSVTSFSIPNMTIVVVPIDTLGNVRRDTIFTEALEASVLRNRTNIDMPFAVSTKNGEVKVVPNPYRVDNDYTFENGGWEGRARSWTESNRLIKFTNLPEKCTIRIFTIAGDLITTLQHDVSGLPSDNPNHRGDKDWNLLSESNRAIASGLYIFSVESDIGTQVGKFVIIR